MQAGVRFRVYPVFCIHMKGLGRGGAILLYTSSMGTVRPISVFILLI
jgi:hypothetical protein